MTRHTLPDDRILRLLADRAMGELAEVDGVELDRYLAANPQIDADVLDRAAAQAVLAWQAGAPPSRLPEALREKLQAAATAHFAGAAGLHVVDAPRQGARLKRPGQRLRILPWLTAAAIVLAAAGWWRAWRTAIPEPPPAQAYDRFVQETPNLIRSTWQAKDAGAGAISGGVVWSDQRQVGFVRLAGLPRNDPSREQYQLWVIDPKRDKHPVDAGVFDTTATGETIVRILPRLPVQQPVAFAITREKPGGVVVTDGPILAVASVP